MSTKLPTEFRHFIFARLFFVLGLRMITTIVIYQVFHLANTYMVGFAGLAEFIPAVIAALFAGHYIDKHNKKNILVVVNYKDVIYLPDEELDLLTNMLTACKLSIADVAIINLNKIETPSYKKIISELNSEVILLFGTEPSALELPVDFPHFQVQSFNSYTFLYTPPLENIKNDKVLKSKLWVCLRRIFNV